MLVGRVWTLTQTEELLWYTLHEEEKEEASSAAEDGLSEPPLKKGRRQLHPDMSRADMSERSGDRLTGEQIRGMDGLDPSQILRDYFQLHINLPALYQGWAYSDLHFRDIAFKFPGRESSGTAVSIRPLRLRVGCVVRNVWDGK